MLPTVPTNPMSATLDDFVAAFEATLESIQRSDLAHFLPPADHPLHDSVLGELIRVELEFDWERGTPRSLEEYRQRFPAFFADRNQLASIAFEEYRLRRQAGQDPDPAAYAQHFGIDTKDWPPRHSSAPTSLRQSGGGPLPQEELLLSVARSYLAVRRQQTASMDAWEQEHPEGASFSRFFREMHGADPLGADRFAEGLIALPRAGDQFVGFDLIEEIGRGAFGRVFLARQPALANRPVALKIAPDIVGESQTLAQLQHTSIVPIYSIHRAGSLQAVCMPYFGVVTLAQVLSELRRQTALPRLGPDLLSRLSLQGRLAGTGPTSTSTLALDATRKRLEKLNYVEAVIWLGSCLADGLAHAHERGILHRDLKPANILLTDEGQPMLLDFNLAEDTKLTRTFAGAVIGGTVPYMSPEQLDAFRGQRNASDQRSDLFALGIILYELLTAHSPFPDVESSAPRSANNDAYLAAVLMSRQTAPKPIQQFNPDVTPAVWSILRRCLDPDPALRYDSARQLQEDLQRQLDAQPLKYAPEPSLRERVQKRFRRSPRLLVSLIAIAAILTAGIAGGMALLTEKERKAEVARNELLVRTDKVREAYRQTIEDIRQAMFLLWINEGPKRRAEGIQLAKRIVDDHRVMEGDAWRDDDRLKLLDEPERQNLAENLGELLLLLARTPVDDKEAKQLLTHAEACFGERVPPSLWLHRAELAERGVDRVAGHAFRVRAREIKPTRARDRYLAARHLLTTRKFREALPAVEEAAALEPDNPIANFLRGLCHDWLDNHEKALGAYDVSVAVARDFHGGYFNRGLAHLKQRNYRKAIADLDRAIALRPDFADGHLNRGLCHRALKHLPEAEADFSSVLKLDPSMTRVYFLRGEIRRQLKKTEEAERDFEAGLKSEPGDDQSWNARGQHHIRRKEYSEALKCFDRGLALNAESRSCLNAKAYVLGQILGRNEEALEVLSLVVRHYPDYVYGYSDRGVLKARLGKRDEALDDARQALARGNDAELSFRVAGVYALTSQQVAADANEALRLLHDALRRGFGAQELASDDDLKPLHSNPEFARLRELARSLQTPPPRSRTR